LLLLGISALIVPSLVKSRAMAAAEGYPFCLAGPEISADPEGPRRDPFVLRPALARSQDLTLLALSARLTMIVELPAEVPIPPVGKPDKVVDVYSWQGLPGDFVKGDSRAIGKDQTSILLDCLPSGDPFADSDTSPAAAALVISRPLGPDAKGAPAWGPRESTIVRLPTDASPIHFGRYSAARIGFAVPLLPDADPMPVTLAWEPDPATWLDARWREQIRDQDAPLDWTTLPVNPLGLQAYEVPSTSLAGSINGTYLLPGPDGRFLTVIACDEYFCRHHSRNGAESPRILSVTYPVGLLPRWREIEDAVQSRVAAAVLTKV